MPVLNDGYLVELLRHFYISERDLCLTSEHVSVVARDTIWTS